MDEEVAHSASFSAAATGTGTHRGADLEIWKRKAFPETLAGKACWYFVDQACVFLSHRGRGGKSATQPLLPGAPHYSKRVSACEVFELASNKEIA